ncbi:MAG: hypothetical protein QOG43_813 [Actinomycetota bacterium]|nr:hypothetical protein [Actinomycetota bacterium]
MRRLLRVVLLVVGLAVGSYALVYYFVLGKGVPKGNWHGTFVTASGKQGALHLEIGVPKAPNVNSGGGDDAGRRFDGTAQACIGRPESQQYEIFGRIRGSDSFMTLSPTGDPVVGLRFSDLAVEWHGDDLTVSGHLSDYDGVNSVSDGANPDHNQPTAVKLQKGADADFESACAGLAAG